MRPRRVLAVIALCCAGLLISIQAQAGGHHIPKGARLSLNLPGSFIEQTASGWTLEKTGAVEQTTPPSVTWNIVAAQSAAVSRQIVVNGRVIVRNLGNAPATIGSVVVDLQHKPLNSWITVSSNVADATLGDGATTALIVDGNSVETVVENAASGTLAFRRAISNVPVSLVPQISLPPGAITPVELTATFNNDVLGLPKNRKVRAVVIVTFGSAAGSGSEANVDINGNGGIDAYEARVDSESAQLGEKRVPTPTPTNSPVTLSDTVADITTTGTVTFSNPVFNLGATTGTVSVNYDGGTAGGTITNCAHLTGTGVDLTACNGQNIAPEQHVWRPGEVVTYTQEEWDTSASSFLLANYALVYTPSFSVEVGIPGPAPAELSIRFTSSVAVLTYLPSIGLDPLVADAINPNESEVAGLFGGDVLALQLDVDFADRGVVMGTSGFRFGDLMLCNFAAPLSDLNDLTVREYLANANVLLGGGTGISTRDQLLGTTHSLTGAFSAGTVSAFANEHLFVGGCP